MSAGARAALRVASCWEPRCEAQHRPVDTTAVQTHLVANRQRVVSTSGSRKQVFNDGLCSASSHFVSRTSAAWFTNYPTIMLRLSYDNVKVTIDLRRTSNLLNILRRAQGFSWLQFTCKIAISSETVLVNWLAILTISRTEILARRKSLS